MMECKGREDKTDQFIRARDRLLKKNIWMEHARTWGHTTKWQKSQIMDTEGGEDFQAKDEAIFQKKITMGEKKNLQI